MRIGLVRFVMLGLSLFGWGVLVSVPLTSVATDAGPSIAAAPATGTPSGNPSSQRNAAAAEAAARRKAAESKRKAAAAKRRAAAAREAAALARVSRFGLSWPRIDMITSGFGWRRTGFHHGIDILCSPRGGEPIRASGNAKVVTAGTLPIYGRAVILWHRGNFTTLYGHLSKINVRAGQYVRRGQVIGRCGSTGHSTNPHLHFEVYRDGRIVNPMAYLPRR